MISMAAYVSVNDNLMIPMQAYVSVNDNWLLSMIAYVNVMTADVNINVIGS